MPFSRPSPPRHPVSRPFAEPQLTAETFPSRYDASRQNTPPRHGVSHRKRLRCGAVCPAENAAAARCVPTAMARCVPPSTAASRRNPCMTAYLFIRANIYAVPPENEILLSAALPGDENGKTRLPNLQLPLRHSEPAGAYHVYPRHGEHFTRARPLPREVQRLKGRRSDPFSASAGGRVFPLYNNIDGFPRRRDAPTLAPVCNHVVPELHFC